MSGAVIVAREDPALWTVEKQNLTEGYPCCFNIGPCALGQELDGSWFRATSEDGSFIGFGWWTPYDGEPNTREISIALVSPGEKKGGELLDRLEEQGRADGVAKFFAIVGTDHPEKEKVRGWLLRHGFKPELLPHGPDEGEPCPFFWKLIG